jgi:hypothetical protein
LVDASEMIWVMLELGTTTSNDGWSSSVEEFQ